MSRFFFTILVSLISLSSSYAQHFKIAGKILDPNDKPIELAYVILSNDGLWSITDECGNFNIRNIPKGKTSLTVRCLGYEEKAFEFDLQEDRLDLIFHLQESNLALDEVTVTAQRKTEDATSSYLIDRTALDHTQVMNITDITSLLPGGKSKDMNLASAQDDRLALRSGKSEKGNPSFGTAIEIDGIRLSNNSSLDETQGISTRNISTTNIESIEVITGIPSVEYGDLSNGIVKVNTRKGKTPLTLDFSTQPNTKQYALSKGFMLGKKGGTINAGFEHTKSNSDLASPHTTYTRNAFSLTYSKTRSGNNQKPITLSAGLSGNIGGFNDKKDPDAFEDSYKKRRDNTLRGNLKINWLLDQSWITNLELFTSFTYSDKLYKVNKKNDSSTAQPLIRGTQEGYFLTQNYKENPEASIIQGPVGNWYELSYTDNKPMDYTLKLKADWIRKFSKMTNKVLIGMDFRSSGNKGKGLYYDDLRVAPSWREYKYSDLPFTNNLAFFAEDKMTLPIKHSTLQLTAGLRLDMTLINQSEYGTVKSLSPRFNAKYIFWKKANKAIKDKYAPYVKQGNYRSEIAVELELASLSFDFRANHCSPRDLRKLALLEEKLGSRQKAREYQEMAQERDFENNPPESGRGMLAYEINSNFMAYIRREVNVYGYDEDQLDRETMGNITWEQIYDLYQKSEKTSKHYSGFEGGVKAVAIWKDLVNEIKTRSASGNKLEQQLKNIPPRQALKR